MSENRPTYEWKSTNIWMKIDQHMSENRLTYEWKSINIYRKNRSTYIEKYNVDKATCATYYILIAYLRATYIIEYQSNQNT